MFCSNCGNKLEAGDVFCTNCGAKTSAVKETNAQVNNAPENNVQENHDQNFSQPNNMQVNNGQSYNEANNIQVNINTEAIKQGINKSNLLKIMMMYFKKPLSFFKELKNSNLVNASIELIIALPIIGGLLNILFTKGCVNSIVSFMKNISMNIMGGFSVGSSYNEDIERARDKINFMIDYKDVFLSQVVKILAVMAITAVLVFIINAVLLKNKMKSSEVFFLSFASYIPFILALAVGSICAFINLIFGILIVFVGIILSLITLYHGLSVFTEENEDKIFRIITIIFVVVALVAAFIITTSISSNILSIANFMENMF